MNRSSMRYDKKNLKKLMKNYDINFENHILTKTNLIYLQSTMIKCGRNVNESEQHSLWMLNLSLKIFN